MPRRDKSKYTDNRKIRYAVVGQGYISQTCRRTTWSARRGTCASIRLMNSPAS